MNEYLEVLKKYAVFSGRARRREYWMFTLINIIVMVVVSVVFSLSRDLAIVGSIIVTLYSLAILLPSLGVSIRRLHDTGRSGWWLLIVFVPAVGGIILLIFTVMDSQPGENKYGPNPKGVSSVQA